MAEISEEMVEAAICAQVAGVNRCVDWPDARTTWPDDWDDAGRAAYRHGMRAAILAVAPLIRAAAFEEAAKYLARQPSFGDGAWAARHVRALAEKEKSP